MNSNVISLRGVAKTFSVPSGDFIALDNVDLDVTRGEFVAVVGQSGSGKSTLLSLLAGIDRPSRGTIDIDGTGVHALTQRAITAWRGRAVGIVFQFFQLLPSLTAIENVMLPMDFCDVHPARERRDRAHAILDRLGVADQADKLPSTLSGGQQQRVAIARALANDPALLLADEPTGNLDSRTASVILDLFARLAAEGQTVVMVTHDENARALASRTVMIADGRIVPNDA